MRYNILATDRKHKREIRYLSRHQADKKAGKGGGRETVCERESEREIARECE